MTYTQENHHVSISTPLGKDKLLVRAFHGEERLSDLFQFSLELYSEEKSLDFSKIVGKSATLKVKLADGSFRLINGVVGRFRQGGSDPRFTTYYAELHPWLWLTTMSADCRIFQNQSVIEIVAGLLSDLGFTDVRDATKGSFEPLEYCVQYNESAFAFVSRLLEDHGIFYFFEHQEGRHTLVLGNDPSAFESCAGAASVTYGTRGNWLQQNSVGSCTIEETVIPGQYAVDDFGFEIPSTDLIGSSEGQAGQEGDSKRRIYEYPGGFSKKDEAEGHAKLRMEEQEVPHRLLRGESYCPAFTAGGKTKLQKHYREDANAAWVLSFVSHSATPETYTNSFEAFPASLPFRPARTTRKPVIPGTQTALVVGKKGEEIWTDKYGRIKVQFHWDQKGEKDENSSCWVRVAQGWAGKGWGQMFLPRIGHEVVVSFLDGDPDRPLVTGSVYNAEQTVPYNLPAEQTKSTIKSNVSKGGGGFNEIRFEDKKDAEEVFLQAERDYNRVVKNNETVKIGFEKKKDGNQTIDVYKNRSITVEEGDQSLHVKKGNETHTVAGTRSVKVTKAEAHTNEDNFDQKVMKNYTLKVDGNLSIEVMGKVTIKSMQDMLLDSKAKLTAKAVGDLATQGMNVSNKAMVDLKEEAINISHKATGNLNSQGIFVTSKASGLQKVEASGAVVIKGSLVKIN